MINVIIAYAILGLAVFAFGQTNNSSNPCALLAASQPANSSAGAHFKPSDVYACLKDVPINNTLAVAQIDWLQSFIPFQSTLANLKNPPSSYPLPAVDIVANLDGIRTKANLGQYGNEYDFESDIFSLIQQSFDGHMAVIPYLIGAFSFIRNVTLISVSSNGTDLPKVYFLSDIQSKDTSFKPSDVLEIDGEDVQKYILERATDLQDLDALYNSMFYNPATSIVAGFGGYVGTAFTYHNDSTSYKFRNGSTIDLNNSATARIPLNGVQSGQDIMELFLLPGDDSPDSPSNSSTPTPTSTTSPSSTTSSQVSATVSKLASLGFPSPVALDPDFSVAGYFLDNSADVAVLNIQSFVADETDGASFQSTITDFLAASKSAGKTKLVIDVRGNPGGIAFTGYDAFKQIFPSVQIFSKMRFRAHPAADALGKTLSQLPSLTVDDLTNAENGDNKTLSLLPGITSNFNYHNSLQRSDGPAFASWNSLYGPKTVSGDQYSNYLSWKFSNEAQDIVSSAGLVVSGYGNESHIAPQVFDNINITLITDSQCSSTCGLFTNLVLAQPHVSSIALGGRPRREPMAAIGGTQGSSVQDFASIQSIAALALSLLNGTDSDSNTTSILPGSDLTTQSSDADISILTSLTQDPPLNLWAGVSKQSINFMDSFAADDKTDTPLQFQAGRKAGCRVFYTKTDILDVSSTWERIANGDYDCVDGGKKAWDRPGKDSSPKPAPNHSGAGKVHVWDMGLIVIGIVSAALLF